MREQNGVVRSGTQLHCELYIGALFAIRLQQGAAPGISLVAGHNRSLERERRAAIGSEEDTRRQCRTYLPWAMPRLHHLPSRSGGV